MPVTATADLAGLYAHICRHPGDSAARLAYADALDEYGTSEAAATAAAIRAAEAITRHPQCSHCTECSAAWCPACGDCTCPDREDRMDHPDCPLHSLHSPHAQFDRWVADLGVAASVPGAASLPCTYCEGTGTLLGCAGDRRNPPCPVCGGAGDLFKEFAADGPGGLRRVVDRKVGFAYGLPSSVWCRQHDVWRSAAGAEPAEWALAVASRSPVVEFDIYHAPVHAPRAAGDAASVSSRDVPAGVFARLTGVAGSRPGSHPEVLYQTPGDARMDLSRAVGGWVRSFL